MPEASRTPGPYSTIVTSKPLRTRRVDVSRLTSATEPSYGTVWMKTNAFSPGWAWMSSNTFSSVSNRVSPSAGSLLAPSLAPGSPSGRGGYGIGDALDGRAEGLARARRPRLAVAARHRLEHERPEAPRQPAVDGHEQPRGRTDPLRPSLESAGTHGRSAAATSLLRGDQQVVLGVRRSQRANLIVVRGWRGRSGRPARSAR